MSQEQAYTSYEEVSMLLFRAQAVSFELAGNHVERGSVQEGAIGRIQEQYRNVIQRLGGGSLSGECLSGESSLDDLTPYCAALESAIAPYEHKELIDILKMQLRDGSKCSKRCSEDFATPRGE